MKSDTYQARISWPFVLLFASILIIVFHLYWDFQNKLTSVAISLATNFAVAAIFSFFQSNEAKRLKKLEDLMVTNVLLDREDEKYYGDLIKKSRKKIDVLGTTASRFMDDFANDESPSEEKKTLNIALARNVKVRVLVAAENSLPEDEDSKYKFKCAAKAFERLKNQYPNFEYKYYNHPPTHSIVCIDEQCIVGPTFSNKQSRHTPAIQMDAISPLAVAYMEYFEREWTSKT